MGEMNADVMPSLAQLLKAQHEIPPQQTGLPPFKSRLYQEDLPPSLEPHESLAYGNNKFFDHFGDINGWFGEHSGEPLLLGEHTMQLGDHYLDLNIGSPTDFSLEKQIDALQQIADYLRKYPHIEWLTGASWLASVGNGKLLEKNGFIVSDIPVPEAVAKQSIREGYHKKSANPRYMERLKNADVKFFYAPRETFLTRWKK